MSHSKQKQGGGLKYILAAPLPCAIFQILKGFQDFFLGVELRMNYNFG